MGKIKILCLFIVYPFTLAHYFIDALRQRDDVEVIICGPTTGNYIPWQGGMYLSNTDFVIKPEIPLPFPPNIGVVDYEFVKSQLPNGWKPDLVLNFDAGIHWRNKPTDGIVATVATDPHALNYDLPRYYSDKFFNMQACYIPAGTKDIYLPYAYSPRFHFPDDTIQRDTDCVLIGMPYPKRVELVERLRSMGISVIFENGPIFHEARKLYNRGRVGLNWSSLDDLNARAFEIPAMKLIPLMNNVPDLVKFELFHSTLLFTDSNHAANVVVDVLKNNMAMEAVPEMAYRSVQGQTYDARIEQILEECKLI